MNTMLSVSKSSWQLFVRCRLFDRTKSLFKFTKLKKSYWVNYCPPISNFGFGPFAKNLELKSRSREHSTLIESKNPVIASTAINQQVCDDPNKEILAFVKNELVQIKSVELYQAIKTMNTDEVLDLVQNSYTHLDRTHKALCLKALYKQAVAIRTDEGTDQENKFKMDIYSDRRFQMLAVLLANDARHLESSIMADMMQFKSYFGFDSVHPLMSIYLDLALEFINDITLDQIVTIADVTSKMTETEKTKLLMRAIEVLCKTRSSQVPMLSGWHTGRILKLFGSSLPYVDQLLSHIWKTRWEISPENCIVLLDGLSNLTNRNIALEDWCINQIIDNFEEFSFVDLKSALAVYKTCTIYEPRLFRKIGLVAIENDVVDFDSSVDLMSDLMDLTYWHTQLFNSIKNQLRSQVPQNSIVPLKKISNLARLLADGCSDNQPALDSLRHYITNLSSTSLQSFSTVELLRFALHLSICGIQLPNIIWISISKILEQGLTAESPATVELLLMLECKTRDSNKWPAENYNMLTNVYKTCSRTPPLLEPAIRTIWPSARHKQFTKSGLYADHIIDGLQSKNDTVNHSAAVLYWSEDHFWRNTGQLRSLPRLYAELIQKDGYNVVVISESQWRKTPEREKFEYLKYRVNTCKDCQDLFALI